MKLPLLIDTGSHTCSGVAAATARGVHLVSAASQVHSRPLSRMQASLVAAPAHSASASAVEPGHSVKGTSALAMALCAGWQLGAACARDQRTHA